MSERRVVITGIGVLTALGVGAERTWSELLAGRSAVAQLQDYDATSLRTQLGAEITGLAEREFVDRRALRTMTRYDVLTTIAAVLAMRDSGLEVNDDPEGRFALFTGSGKETSELENLEDPALAVRGADGQVDMRRFGEIVVTQVPPLFFIEGLQGAALFYISAAYSLHGPNTHFAGTAEAGLTAIGRAFRAVRRGEADAAIAGGGDAPVCWWNMSKIDSLGLTTRRNDLGAGACRPYDRHRDGSVMGEGGAFVVLEEYEAALRRGACCYAEITGFGSGTDIERLLSPDPTGRPLAEAIGHALRDAGSDAGAIDYVAAHGSGTRRGDASESRALASVFGVDGDGPLGSSVKPATGHLGAAAGALNAAVAALAIHHGAAPPTLNLHDPDPACAGIPWLSGEPAEMTIREALALARGLEGQNVALTLRTV